MKLPRTASGRLRGQPLIMLVAVMVGWTALRSATWAAPDLPVDKPVAEQAAAVAVAPAAHRAAPAPVVPQMPPFAWSPLPFGTLAKATADARVPLAAPPAAVAPALAPEPPVALDNAAPAAPIRPTPLRAAVGHALLLAAGFGHMELPPELAALFAARRSGPGAPAQQAALADAAPAETRAPARTSRWSADGWLLWRDDTSTPLTTGQPSYGRSQLGAVVRYRLAPASAHAPQAYLRGGIALQGVRENVAALGLSARPLARVPLRAAVELRASEGTQGTTVRPAAFVVTEVSPQALPGGLTAEVYGAAGYIGGRGHTAFADGQARVERTLVRHDDFDLRAGAGAWGGR